MRSLRSSLPAWRRRPQDAPQLRKNGAKIFNVGLKIIACVFWPFAAAMTAPIKIDDTAPRCDQRTRCRFPDFAGLPATVDQQDAWRIRVAQIIGFETDAAKSLETDDSHTLSSSITAILERAAPHGRDGFGHEDILPSAAISPAMERAAIQ